MLNKRCLILSKKCRKNEENLSSTRETSNILAINCLIQNKGLLISSFDFFSHKIALKSDLILYKKSKKKIFVGKSKEIRALLEHEKEMLFKLFYSDQRVSV